jgi:hypothetical protein
MLADMGRLRNWLQKAAGGRSPEAMDQWAEISAVGRSTPDPPGEVSADDDLPPLGDGQTDWTVDPIETIPPWRRRDRALIDAARSASAASTGPGDLAAAAELARDLRRLADLNADSKISDVEFIAGVRSRLAQADTRQAP